MITGVWIQKEECGQLAQHALRSVENFSVINNNLYNKEGNERRGKLLVLEVRNTIDNVGLQRLYQRKGFGVKLGETTKKDTKWMALNIGYEILHTAY